MTNRPLKKRMLAFSLVEMLVVIAVIGVITAVAIPTVSRIKETAQDANQRRNAQNLLSVYSAAQAAGYDFAYEDGDTASAVLSEPEIIEAVITGTTIESGGPMADTFFGVNGLNNSVAVDEKVGAAKYIAWDADLGGLIFDE